MNVSELVIPLIQRYEATFGSNRAEIILPTEYGEIIDGLYIEINEIKNTAHARIYHATLSQKIEDTIVKRKYEVSHKIHPEDTFQFSKIPA